jgi:hypothetical protein
MIDPSERLDIEAVVRDTADYFAAPMDVVNDSRFTHDEKHRILESWALDAQATPMRTGDRQWGRRTWPGFHEETR